jgi:hypothetical protein
LTAAGQDEATDENVDVNLYQYSSAGHRVAAPPSTTVLAQLDNTWLRDLYRMRLQRYSLALENTVASKFMRLEAPDIGLRGNLVSYVLLKFGTCR